MLTKMPKLNPRAASILALHCDPLTASRFIASPRPELVAHVTFARLEKTPLCGPKTITDIHLWLKAHGRELPGAPAWVTDPKSVENDLYFGMRRVEIPPADRERLGLADADDLVEKLNVFRKMDREWPVSQAEFPIGLTRLRRLLAEYEKRIARPS